MIHLYGIANCDTVKKARQWLEINGAPHTFHDFKKEAPTRAQCEAWASALGAETLINRRGTTWRQCDAQTQAAAATPAGAAALAQAMPSVIKRPLMMWPNGDLSVGFNAEQWQQRLAT